jgi:hypothetical protein
MQALIDKYEKKGYEVDFRDGDRYASLFKRLCDGSIPVAGNDQLKLGERIDIGSGRVIKSNYYKRGCMWASSSEIACSGGNVYQYGDDSEILEEY